MDDRENMTASELYGAIGDEGVDVVLRYCLSESYTDEDGVKKFPMTYGIVSGDGEVIEIARMDVPYEFMNNIQILVDDEEASKCLGFNEVMETVTFNEAFEDPGED